MCTEHRGLRKSGWNAKALPKCESAKYVSNIRGREQSRVPGPYERGRPAVLSKLRAKLLF